MAKYLQQNLVQLRCFRFASQAATELALYHVECRFHVASFVVVLGKLLVPVQEVVV